MAERPAGELTIERLQACCAHWQRVLRLLDWEIRLAIVRMNDLGEGTLGDCWIAGLKQQAKIRMLDTRDVEGQAFMFDGDAWDWEITIVHELLHLRLSERDLGLKADDKDPRWIALERTIDILAKAFLQLGRWSHGAEPG